VQADYPFAETCKQMLRDELPNLFRLYLNPYVVQTCLCLERYIQSTWRSAPGVANGGTAAAPYQTFLANGFDEALSGAIKLARYCASRKGKPTTGLVIDGSDRLGPFAADSIAAGAKIEFLPGLVVVGKDYDLNAIAAPEQSFSFVVLVAGVDGTLEKYAEQMRRLICSGDTLLITCVDRATLASLRQKRGVPPQLGIVAELAPDIVVFDESFVNHDVPFGAFTARQALYDHWNRPSMSTFHSTTYQPNTIASLHFMNCLERADPEFYHGIANDVQQIHDDVELRGTLLRRLYSPSLYKAICATGFNTAKVRAAGDFIFVNGQKVFDAVGGVACSVRGHNPSPYVEEMEALPGPAECKAELEARLRELMGLKCLLPAVSGASAVESGLKLALAAQFPRRHVLALKSGFGGKTLFALTGTWNAYYKDHIDPLYSDVSYVDPFSPDAIKQIEAILDRHAVAVVQIELIQGVGGVRCVPAEVIRYLETGRTRWGYLLLVDEVQTGMYRTGPFSRSQGMGLTPDLLVLGKAASDMMFPFAVLVYSSAVQAKLQRQGSDLETAIRARYGYEFGYKTMLNVLRRADELRLQDRIAESSALAAELLTAALAFCKAVKEVRVYGLLIGIELDATRWPQRWFRKRLFWFYLSNMLRHPRYPVLVGFCQYEPNVLKITPPLTVAPAEIRQMCATIADVLHRPFYRLFAGAVGGMLRSIGIGRRMHEHHSNVRAHEPVPS
jgi:acetylornithine/succinyldiaminopimelate/putrescine aminotransferase